ncbi:MAG: hypothetical protein NXH87_11895 [Rhodobiaceae bacterium]|nr:hypothetical protein [Rhodobiaceae bacterium]
MLFYPERIALAGVLTYAVLSLIAPLDRVFDVSWASLGYVLLCYLAFLIGCLLMQRRKRRMSLPTISEGLAVRTFWLFAVVGAVGMAIRLYDKWVLRQSWFARTVMESRELLSDIGAGPLAAIGGALYPFCFIPLVIWWARLASMRSNNAMKWIAFILFLAPAADALLVFSRSQMLVGFGMMFVTASCILYRGKLIPARMIWPILFGGGLVVVTSVLVFQSRLDQMEVELAFSIVNSGYAYVLTPNQTALNFMIGGDSILGEALRSAIPLMQYYLHGLLEFGLLWDRPDVQSFGYGAELLAPFVKLLSIVGVGGDVVESRYYRIGVFTSFFGPLWVDFGWLGPFFMTLFGVLCKFLAQRVQSGSIPHMPLYFYLCVVLFFMPVVNFLISAQGMYTITAFVVFLVIFRSRRRVTVRVRSHMA